MIQAPGAGTTRVMRVLKGEERFFSFETLKAVGIYFVKPTVKYGQMLDIESRTLVSLKITKSLVWLSYRE
jgi:hypothetical protein